jgi:hypothetical protein
MKRLIGRALNVSATVSVAMFFATCALWVRSHFVRDGGWSGASFIVWSDGGRIEGWHASTLLLPIVYESNDPTTWSLAEQRTHSIGPYYWYVLPKHGDERLADASLSAPTFHVESSTPNGIDFSFSVPHWALAAVFLLPAAVLVVVRRARRRRFVPGLCRACGYDLRATPDKCPECGTLRMPQGVE